MFGIIKPIKAYLVYLDTLNLIAELNSAMQDQIPQGRIFFCITFLYNIKASDYLACAEREAP